VTIYNISKPEAQIKPQPCIQYPITTQKIALSFLSRWGHTKFGRHKISGFPIILNTLMKPGSLMTGEQPALHAQRKMPD
jgi:hypothetical protein